MRTNPIFVAALALLTTAALPMNAQQPAYACAPDPPSPAHKILVIDASKPGLKSGSLQYANKDSLWIVVENINPFVSNYVLKVKRTPVTEPPVSDFLVNLGGIVAGVVPKPSKTPQNPTPTDVDVSVPCGQALQSITAAFTTLQSHESDLNRAITAITTSYGTQAETYQKDLRDARDQTKCSEIQTAAETLHSFLAQIMSPDQQAVKYIGGIPSDGNPIQNLQTSISETLAEAKVLRAALLNYRRNAIGNAECTKQLNAHSAYLQDVDDFVDDLVGGSGGTAEVDGLRSQLTNLSNRYAQFVKARTGINALLNRSLNGNPFTITKEITDDQADDQITLEPAAAVLTDASSAQPPAKPSGDSAAKSAPSPTAVFDRTIHFGYGARFSIGGGIVTSFLENRQFTTANGQVAFLNNSRTRILPIAALNARLFDCDSERLSCLARPQFTFGITAKADDKGTSPEYLIGPSWPLVKGNLFLTVGAYAGQQQRLLGGLQVGQTTTLSAANLPVAKEYHWSAAIAITWKLK